MLIQKCYNYLTHPFVFEVQLYNDGKSIFLQDPLQKMFLSSEFISSFNELIQGINFHGRF